MAVPAAPVVSSPRTRHARRLFSGLAGNYDWMATLLSLGQDPRWRRQMVSSVPAGPGDRVRDAATGAAAVALELVRRTGGSAVGRGESGAVTRAGRREGPRA